MHNTNCILCACQGSLHRCYWQHSKRKEQKIKTENNNERSSINIKCDLLAIAGCWTPTVHLFTQSKGKLKFRDVDGSFIPNEVYQDTLCVGSCNGDYYLNEILLQTQKDTLIYLNDNQENKIGEVNYKSDNLKYGKHQNVFQTRDHFRSIALLKSKIG